MAGIAVRQLGYRVAVSTRPIAQVIGPYTLAQYWKRHVRWGRIRKAQAPVAFFLEPLLHAFPLASLAALGGRTYGLGLESALVSLVLHATCDRILRVGESYSGPGRRLRLMVWIAREAMAPVLWFVTALRSEVDWRGRKLKVEWGGILAAATPTSARSGEVRA